MPGAPRTIITINFNNITDAFQSLKLLCEDFPTTKAKVKRFFTMVKDYFKDEDFKDQETQLAPQTSNVATQTDDDEPGNGVNGDEK